MPSNPKRTPPRGRPQPPSTAPTTKTAKKQPVELPFDDAEVTPLRADDPRPQRVPQFPTGAKRPVQSRTRSAEEAIPTTVYDLDKDAELPQSFELADDGYLPAFLYVDRGPGAGQLVPIRQGATVIG